MKYPYISDRTMYAAVRYAGKLVRENGHLNHAITTAAGYYKVDQDELRRHLEARTKAGRNIHPAEHYKIEKYIVTFSLCTADMNREFCERFAMTEKVRARDQKHAAEKVIKKWTIPKKIEVFIGKVEKAGV